MQVYLSENATSGSIVPCPAPGCPSYMVNPNPGARRFARYVRTFVSCSYVRPLLSCQFEHVVMCRWLCCVQAFIIISVMMLKHFHRVNAFERAECCCAMIIFWLWCARCRCPRAGCHVEFCTHCKASPYHFRLTCVEVGDIKAMLYWYIHASLVLCISRDAAGAF